MALMDIDIESEILGLKVGVRVIFPIEDRQLARKVPALYLLHGLGDDESVWCRFSAVERYVRRLDMAVVMPAVHRSFYQNTQDGRRYFDFVSEELPETMERLLPISPRREDRFAAGLSMGGYGALKLGLSAPYRYSLAASLSGAVDLKRVMEAKEALPEVTSVFGERISPEADLYRLSRRAAEEGHMPALYQACGSEDFMIEDNREFSRFIKGLCPDHTYEEWPGGHNWDFWDEGLKHILSWIRERRDINEF